MSNGKDLKKVKAEEDRILKETQKIEEAEERIKKEEKRILSSEAEILENIKGKSSKALEIDEGVSKRELKFLRLIFLRRLARHKFISTLLIIIATVLIWRGIWHGVDELPFLSYSLVSLGVGIIILWIINRYTKLL